MHRTNEDLDAEAFRVAAKMAQVAQEATNFAVEENRRLGVPNVYYINGRIYYELPNGELSLEDPGVTPPNSSSAAP